MSWLYVDDSSCKKERNQSSEQVEWSPISYCVVMTNENH